MNESIKSFNEGEAKMKERKEMRGGVQGRGGASGSAYPSESRFLI